MNSFFILNFQKKTTIGRSKKMKLKNWALLLAFGLLLSVLVACGGGDGGTSDNAEQGTTGTEDTATEGENVLNFVNGDQIPSMDPSLATDEYGFQFLGATMEGLYRLGENAQPVEGIAKD